MNRRSSTAAPLLAVVAIVLPLLLLGLYIGGYFWLGEFCIVQNVEVIDERELLGPERPCRSFNSPWLVTLFQPLGRIESAIEGVKYELIFDPALPSPEE
jgi:hypothetical protein